MNNTIPETRNSLILRLPDKQDVQAWDQFVDIYQPLVFRLARSKGFQEADAHDVVQEVMVAVSRAVERWEPNLERGRFRDWLFRIARNLMINFLTRRKHQALGAGGSGLAQLLNEHPDSQLDQSEASQEFDLEYRRELFLIAAERVRKEVRAQTWEAFHLTNIESNSVAVAAGKLGLTEGAVLVARCRVLARLRDAVRSMEKENMRLEYER